MRTTRRTLAALAFAYAAATAAEVEVFFELPRVDVRAAVIEQLKRGIGDPEPAVRPPRPGELAPVAVEIPVPDIRARVMRAIEEERRRSEAEAAAKEQAADAPETVPPAALLPAPSQPAAPAPQPTLTAPAPKASAPPPPAPKASMPPPRRAENGFVQFSNKVITIGDQTEVDLLRREFQQAGEQGAEE